MDQQLQSLGSIAGAVFGTALLFGASVGLGELAVPPGRRIGRRYEAVVLRIAAGLNLLAVLGAALGQLGLLAGGRSVWLLVALTVLACVLLWRRHRAGASPSTITPTKENRLTSRGGRFLFGLMVVTLGLTIGPALCYPVGWDELVYHSVLPRRWLADGNLEFYVDLPYSGFPSLGEILCWLVAPIEYVIAPRLIVWLCWVLAIVFIYLLLRRRLTTSAAAVLALVFAGSATMLVISANCYVESILLMNIAAMLLAVQARTPHDTAAARRGPPVLLGILAGGAAAVKLTGLAALMIPLLWYLSPAWASGNRGKSATGGAGRRAKKKEKERQPQRATQPQHGINAKSAVRALLICLATAFVVSLPFYLRPWLAKGNPFYPYFDQWFTSNSARIEMSQFHHAIGGAVFGVGGLAGFVSGFLLLAFSSKNYDGVYGAQLLVLILLAVIAIVSARRPQRRRVVLWPAAIALGFYTFWFFTAQQARFAAPAVLGMVLLAAQGLQPIRGTMRRAVLALLLVAALFSAPWRSAGYYLGSWLTLFGGLSRTLYVDENTDFQYLPLVNAVDELTPDDARLLLLFEHRSFYMPRPSTIVTPFFQEAGFTPPEQFADPQRFAEVLTQSGATHLVMSKGPIGPDQAPGYAERLDPLLRNIEAAVEQQNLTVLWESDYYLLFEISAGGSNQDSQRASLKLSSRHRSPGRRLPSE